MNLTQLVLHLNIYALINVSDAMVDGVEDGMMPRRKSLGQGSPKAYSPGNDLSFEMPGQFCPCATTQPEDTREWERKHSKRRKRSPLMDAKDRIVNGYNTKLNKASVCVSSPSLLYIFICSPGWPESGWIP